MRLVIAPSRQALVRHRVVRENLTPEEVHPRDDRAVDAAGSCATSKLAQRQIPLHLDIPDRALHRDDGGVCQGIDVYFPSALESSQVRFMDSARGRNQIVSGSHEFGMTRFKKGSLELPISDATRRAVPKDNAVKVLKLD